MPPPLSRPYGGRFVRGSPAEQEQGRGVVQPPAHTREQFVVVRA
ncbi:hypothetical protein [Streptomyces sp. NPDC058294]